MATASSLGRMREGNRRAVTARMAAQGPMSRADLARGTGLSRTTVSSLVTELIEAGVVVETSHRGQPHKGGSGRPPLLVALRPAQGAVAGVDLGHRHLRVAVSAPAGEVLAEEVTSLDVDEDARRALDRAAELVRTCLASAGLDRGELQAVGMCVPAPLDRASARLNTRILPGWREVAPGEELQRRVGVPVHVDNDANLGALAELTSGSARGLTDLIYVKVASGLGAGIVLGGRLHRGATGLAGELGHVQVGEDGPVCRCGNRGCLETLVSGARLLSVLQPAHDEELSTRRLLELDASGDAGVRRVLGDAGRTLGRALADLCNSLNPEALVLGGSVGAASSLRQGIRDALDRYAQPDTAAAVRVIVGELGDRAEVEGALSLASSRINS